MSRDFQCEAENPGRADDSVEWPNARIRLRVRNRVPLQAEYLVPFYEIILWIFNTKLAMEVRTGSASSRYENECLKDTLRVLALLILPKKNRVFPAHPGSQRRRLSPPVCAAPLARQACIAHQSY